MIERLNIYISDSFDVYENLSTEKYLFDTAAENSCTLYLWQNKSAVVIGRNQNPHAECNLSLIREENISVARRLSGGGAVFHDLGNLNFTFISSKDNSDLSKNMRVIQSACAMASIGTEISGRNDILACGRKFSGNAFYNSEKKSFHHGTIMICSDIDRMERILTPSKAKLDSKGIKSVKSRVINLCDLSPGLDCSAMKEYMIRAFEKVYNLKADIIKNVDFDKIFPLSREYSSWEYIYTKTSPYTFSNSTHFSWGSAEMNLEIRNECIRGVCLFTDSLDWELPKIIKQCLVGCNFRYQDVSQHLFRALQKETAQDILSLLF